MPPRKHLDDPKVIKSAHFWQPNAAEQGTGETTEVIFDPTDLWINDLNEKIVLSFTWQMSLDFIFLAGSGCLECIQGYGYTGGCIQKGSPVKIVHSGTPD